MNSVSLKYVQFEKHKAAYDPYFILPANHKDCKWLGDKDSSCSGYSIDFSDDRCFLSRFNIYNNAPSCSTCYFAGKEHMSSIVLCPITSSIPQSTTNIQGITILLSATKPESFTKTINYTTDLDKEDIAIGNTSCVCVCKYLNQTLDESIERRRKELVLNKTRLSAAIKKLTFVSDYIMSVEVVGTVAIIGLVLCGLIFFVLISVLLVCQNMVKCIT